MNVFMLTDSGFWVQQGISAVAQFAESDIRRF